jgi:hypothetical protein
VGKKKLEKIEFFFENFDFFHFEGAGVGVKSRK